MERAVGPRLIIPESGYRREAVYRGGNGKVHLRHIMGKLGAQGRTQTVTIAVRRGIIHL